MNDKIHKTRTNIPTDVKRMVLVECGFKCSVPRCSVQWPTLQFHHINGDPSDHSLNNILVLCPTHHQMATSKQIDRKHCKMLKNILSTFAQYETSPEEQIRSRLLYSLAAELYVNLNILRDRKFQQLDNEELKPMVYPRLLRTVLDQALASGFFIYEQDNQLFRLLFSWSEILNDFNHRLDITEYRIFSHLSTLDELKHFQQKLVNGKVLQSTRKQCMGLAKHLIENYDQESGVALNTVFFGVEKNPVEAG